MAKMQPRNRRDFLLGSLAAGTLGSLAACLKEGNHQSVMDFQKMGSIASLAHPTCDHFLPLLYCLGLKENQDELRTFNDNFQWPAVSMRSIVIS